jgi:hypothetical protein
VPDRAAGQYVKSEQFCVGEALNWSMTAKLHQFMGQMRSSDFGGAASVVPVRIGDALALYKTLAGNKLEDNLNPVRRIYYAGSTMGACRHHCRIRWAPHSACRPTKPSCEKSSPRAFEVSGAPFNMILEARR